MSNALTAEQIAERCNGIGGSDATRLVKGEWRDLFLEKTGRKEPNDLSGVLRVQMGIWTEPYNRLWFTRETGRAVTNANELRVHPTIPHMRCNIDGLTTTSRGHPALWEGKHVGNAADTTVVRYTPQATHNALVCGLDWWVLSFFVGNSKWEMVEQEVDPLFADELLAMEGEFWSYVVRDIEPADRVLAVEPPKPVRYRTVDLTRPIETFPNWGDAMADLFGKFASTHDAAVAHAIARDEIKKLLPEDVSPCIGEKVIAKRARNGSLTISLRGKE